MKLPFSKKTVIVNMLVLTSPVFALLFLLLFGDVLSDPIYKQDISHASLTFGEITEFGDVGGDSCTDIAEDLLEKGNILVLQPTLISTISKGKSNPLITNDGFVSLTSFVQLNETHVVITDEGAFCLYLYDRLGESISTYAGKCGEKGSTDGELLNARFSLPSKVTRANPQQLFLIEKDINTIKVINIIKSNVKVFVEENIELENMVDISLSKSADSLLVFGANYIKSVSIADTARLVTSVFSTELTPAHQDGPFSEANFLAIQEAIVISSGIFLAAEKGSSLRVIDIEKETVSSVCKSEANFQPGGVSKCSIPDSKALTSIGNSVYVSSGNNILELKIFFECPDWPPERVNSEWKGTKYEVNFTCAEDSVLVSGELAIACNHQRRWPQNLPVCARTLYDCPAPSDGNLTNGLVKQTNSSITYTCLYGYSIANGNQRRYCNSTKHWTGNPPTCEKVVGGKILSCADSRSWKGISKPCLGLLVIMLAIGVIFFTTTIAMAIFCCRRRSGRKPPPQNVAASNPQTPTRPPAGRQRSAAAPAKSAARAQSKAVEQDPVEEDTVGPLLSEAHDQPAPTNRQDSIRKPRRLKKGTLSIKSGQTGKLKPKAKKRRRGSIQTV